jgi:hypothetical protein
VDTPKKMDTFVYFERISEEISKQLEAATHDIVVAIDLFTHQSIFNILRRKAGSGVTVNLLYLDDNINNKASFNIRQLEAFEVNLFPISSEMHPNDLMRNKFCVIDGKHVISGSYNWTNRAKYNDENITVFLDNPEIANRFLKEFDEILEKYNYKKIFKVSPQSIIPRLELVKNFVLMEEWDTAQEQLNKLRSFEEVLALEPLFLAIEKQDSQTVTTWIATFVKDKMSLVIHEDENIIELKIELRMFELKVVALSAEKDELEKQIVSFHQRTNLILGELTTRYLQLQAVLMQKMADEAQSEPSKKERIQAEAREAWDEYKTYQKGFDKLMKMPMLPKLSDGDRKQIKDMFRKASQLCHPDKFSESQREVANNRFIELKAAYDNNDLGAVKYVYDDLINNRPFRANVETLSDGKLLKKEVKRLEGTAYALLVEILDLKSQISDLGIDQVVSWDEYFDSQKQNLMDAIEQLELELPHV